MKRGSRCSELETPNPASGPHDMHLNRGIACSDRNVGRPTDSQRIVSEDRLFSRFLTSVLTVRPRRQTQRAGREASSPHRSKPL